MSTCEPGAHHHSCAELPLQKDKNNGEAGICLLGCNEDWFNSDCWTQLGIVTYERVCPKGFWYHASLAAGATGAALPSAPTTGEGPSYRLPPSLSHSAGTPSRNPGMGGENGIGGGGRGGLVNVG